MGYKADFYRSIFRILINSMSFAGSGNYWDKRYQKGEGLWRGVLRGACAFQGQGAE